MKWSLFNWKKPVVSSGEPEDYQVVKNTVNQNSTNIRNLNNQVNTAQGTADRNEQSINSINTQLTNTVSTNTAQTITGQKTINAQTTISANPTPLILKANNNSKTYLVFRDSNNNSNLSIGAEAAGTSIEMNRGHLTIKNIENNKNVAFDNVARVKLNNSILECSTEINAGYGGTTVKFIPEDNSTKTLQFFNNNNNDIRRFKLAVPEPVDNNNPATKNYVDSQISNAVNAGPYIRYQDLRISTWNQAPGDWGIYYVYTVDVAFTDTIFLGATVHYPSQTWGRAVEFGYNFGSSPNRIYFNFRYQKTDNQGLPPIDTTFIRIFYVGNVNTLSEDGPFSIIPQEANNEN